MKAATTKTATATRVAAALILTVLGIAAARTVLAAPPTGDQEMYVADLTGEGMEPDVATNAAARIEIVVAADESFVEYRIQANGIDDVTDVWVHAGRPSTDFVELALLFEAFPPGRLTTVGYRLTPSLVGYRYPWLLDQLRSGNAYGRVDTVASPHGLIRGLFRPRQPVSRPVSPPVSRPVSPPVRPDKPPVSPPARPDKPPVGPDRPDKPPVSPPARPDKPPVSPPAKPDKPDKPPVSPPVSPPA